jgi:hypothetical protein
MDCEPGQHRWASQIELRGYSCAAGGFPDILQLSRRILLTPANTSSYRRGTERAWRAKRVRRGPTGPGRRHGGLQSEGTDVSIMIGVRRSSASGSQARGEVMEKENRSGGTIDV